MPIETTTIYLADFLCALHLLEVQDEVTRRAIAHLLGLELSRLPSNEATAPGAPQASVTPAVDREITRPIEAETPTARRPERRVSGTARRSALERLPAEETPWKISVEPLPRRPSEERSSPPPLDPLFAPQWTRGILTTALATLSSEGELDTERIVEALAQRRYLKRLPNIPLPTLRRGVQVLVDHSKAMTLFHRDQDWLVNEILRVVGKDKTQVLRFAGCPGRKAGTGPRRNWDDYQPPLPGTPVLLLTDLGIGRPPLSTDWANVEEWLAFAQIVRKAGCPLVALVPYGPTLPSGLPRWPAELAGTITIFQWDRRTSATTIRNRLGLGHEVLE